MHRALTSFVSVVMFVLGCGWALAHPMPNSLIDLEVGETSIAARLTIPLIELGLALQRGLSGDATALTAADKALVAQYIAAHTAVATPDGAAWTIAIDDVSIVVDHSVGPYADAVVLMTLAPPEGTSVRHFTLNYDAVLGRVVTHAAVVSVHQDWFSGQIEGGETLGVIQVNPVNGVVAPLAVSLSEGSYWYGFVSTLGLGASHIAEGTDHLLFLLTLLLPAPLLAAGGRWKAQASMRATLVSIATIVTAFTVGHSIALLVATLYRLQLPQQPIEVLIALTILVSAIHALHPIFPKRVPLVAGIFGLIHGMAFSFTLVNLNLSTPQLIISLLGFNLGIEFFQLALVASIMPALLLFARSRVCGPVRTIGAVVATAASLGWGADRMGWSSLVAEIVDGAGQQLPWIICGLTLLALLVWWQAHQSRLP